ncbi:MAG: hypothetical protein WC470_01805 [Candidatus Paceibacterota bacterium]
MFFFFKKLFSKKFALFFTCFVILGVLFFPMFSFAAGPLDFFGGIMEAIASILMSVPIFLLKVSSGFLNWITSGDFMKISMTNSGLTPDMPGYNVVVGTGWGIVRNIANIALVFGLVVIAMSIILGYQETAAKKMLVNFILIAILINFTPVICGIMIDGANILMNSFLKGGISNTLIDAIQEQITNIGDKGADNIPTLAVVFVFCIIAAAIYMLYALLFLTRYVMLWILIIVSPIAFATYVFPKSSYIKKIFPSVTYWDEWWETFLQWVILGIPAAMALYLSNVLAAAITSGIISSPSPVTGVSDLSNAIFANLFSYAIPFIFLIQGFFICMSSGGAVGAKLKGYGDKAWAKTGGAAIGAATGAAVAGGVWAKGRAGALGGAIKEGTIGTVLGGTEGFGVGEEAYQAREAGRQKWSDWKQRAKEVVVDSRLASPGFATNKSEIRKQAESFAQNIDFDDYNKHKDRYSFEQRQAIEQNLIKKDVGRFLKSENATDYQSKMQAVLRHDDKTKEYTTIKTKAVMDSMYKNSNFKGSADWEAKSGINLSQEIGKLSGKDVNDIVTAEALSEPKIFNALRVNQIKKIMDEGNGKKLDALSEAIKDNNTKYKDHFAQLQKDMVDQTKTSTDREAAHKEALIMQENIGYVGSRLSPQPTSKIKRISQR